MTWHKRNEILLKFGNIIYININFTEMDRITYIKRHE